MEKFNCMTEDELMSLEGGLITITGPMSPAIISKYAVIFAVGFYNGFRK